MLILKCEQKIVENVRDSNQFSNNESTRPPQAFQLTKPQISAHIEHIKEN